MRRLLDHLAQRRVTDIPIVCCDAGYSPAALGVLSEQRVHIVVRLRTDSVLFTEPPPATPGTPGRPRRHGPPMKLPDQATWPDPDQAQIVAAGPDRAGLTVTCWHRLHLRPSRAYREPDTADQPAKANRRLIHGDLIRIRSNNPRHKTIWLWHTGPPDNFNLDTIWRAYLRRFGIEHFFRFGKQHLAWTTPRPRTPHQAERWSWLVATAYTQLLLARGLTRTRLLPWERGHLMSPHRVKRGFRALRAELGTPAQPRQNSTPGQDGHPAAPTSTNTPATPKPKSLRVKTPGVCKYHQPLIESPSTAPNLFAACRTGSRSAGSESCWQ
ncbi:transposase [Lentzea sp. BCCO 10_0856]|uniref:Transposase n=1 Tax=Lentzea miocenica TaxID=3095431 RepID=A0ABU4TEA3_9PSEU|nr:transposase [Lentzea sp. BCCO 10_0856]MDX8036511.1 transposase [Lentzea sp. BCCO 10_0856]